MDGVASVITIVGLALHSTQIVYNTVSSVKYAPRTLHQLSTNLRNLSDVLQQLDGFGDDLNLAVNLPQLVSSCAQYVGEFEIKIRKLDSPHDKKVARLWKNVKATLQESELDRMSAILHQHSTVLSLQIGIIKSKRIERIETFASRQASLSSTHTTMLESTRYGVDQLRTTLGDLQTSSQASAQNLSLTMRAVGDEVVNIANISTEQSAALSVRMDSILELLKRLDLFEKSQQPDIEARAGVAVMSPDDQETGERIVKASDDYLEEALNRLSKLAEKTDRNLSSLDAESIINDMDQILVHLIEAEVLLKPHGIVKNGDRTCEGRIRDAQEKRYQDDIKQSRRVLSASNRIALKKKVRSKYHHVTDRRLHLMTRYHAGTSPSGIFAIKAEYGIHDTAVAGNIINNASVDEVLESFDVSVKFVHKHFPKTQIAFALSQRTLLESCVIKTPVLSVSALLPVLSARTPALITSAAVPDESEVFRVIKLGRLDQLMRILNSRRISLTTRDPEGRCLLNHAIQANKPNICKFLIDMGADVDFIESRGDKHIVHALNLFDTREIYDGKRYLDVPSEILTNYIECCRLLLEAGADPTISTQTCSNYITTLFRAMSKESLATLFNHASDFLPSGMDLRKFVAMYIGIGRWTFDVLTVLLRMIGSKLPVQDLSSTLSDAILGSRQENESGILRALISLIQNGADMTKDGRRVSMIACNPLTRYLTNRTLSHETPNQDSRLRRIWAEALAACGYDAEEYISQSRRFPEMSGIDVQKSENSNETSSDENAMSTTNDGEPSEHSKEEGAFRTAGAHRHSNFSSSDWAVLEEDTSVWQD